MSAFLRRVFHAVCPSPMPTPACFQPHQRCTLNYENFMLTISTVRAYNLVVLSNDRPAVRAVAGGEPHALSSVTSYPRRPRKAFARIHTKHRRDRIKVWSLIWCPRVRRQTLQASIEGKDVPHRWPRRSHHIDTLHPITTCCFATQFTFIVAHRRGPTLYPSTRHASDAALSNVYSHVPARKLHGLADIWDASVLPGMHTDGGDAAVGWQTCSWRGQASS